MTPVPAQVADNPAWWRLAAYGLLGLPLAMAALPVYVQVAAYYSTMHGVALAQLGWVLFGARLLDTLQDPLQGHLIDRLRNGIAPWMAAGGAVLALAFAGLWQPPASGASAAAWLGPATLALFFIRDRLQAAPLAGAFLGCYFVAAACGLPLWTALARRIGVLPCWRIGMALAIASFAGAGLLGAGDVLPYFFVCIAAGAALGADLAMPPVLLAELLGAEDAAGACYGVLTLLGKLALALSGLALPLLAALGYRPGIAGGAALALLYAAVPCALKLLAMASLWRPLPALMPALRYRSSP